MKILIIINDAPYGTEKAYNALRMARTLLKEHPDIQVRIFLMADAVSCALPDQQTTQGYYNIERMLKSAIARGAQVALCGTCAEARGLKNLKLVQGAGMGTMSQLSQWVVEAEKVLTF